MRLCHLHVAGLAQFLSTPSARRATPTLTPDFDRITISIHALREEGDVIYQMQEGGTKGISIHALREEGDKFPIQDVDVHFNFYPRPPRGGRPSITYPWWCRALFLSTPSARRATLRFLLVAALTYISIHALREEGDRAGLYFAGLRRKFLSTPSARRATLFGSRSVSWALHFYPRPPRGGRHARSF